MILQSVLTSHLCIFRREPQKTQKALNEYSFSPQKKLSQEIAQDGALIPRERNSNMQQSLYWEILFSHSAATISENHRSLNDLGQQYFLLV